MKEKRNREFFGDDDGVFACLYKNLSSCPACMCVALMGVRRLMLSQHVRPPSYRFDCSDVVVILVFNLC